MTEELKEGDKITIKGEPFTFSSYGREVFRNGTTGIINSFKVMENQSIYPIELLNTKFNVLIPKDRQSRAIASHEPFILAYVNKDGILQSVEGAVTINRAVHAWKVLSTHDKTEYQILNRKEVAWITPDGKHCDYKGRDRWGN